MKLILLLVVVIFSYNEIVNGQGKSGNVKKCGGETCPQDSILCRKNGTTTPDDKTLWITIDCLDSNRTVLASFNKSEHNPVEPFDLQIFSISTMCNDDESEEGNTTASN